MVAHLQLLLISLLRFEGSSKSTKKSASGNPSGIPRGRKPYPRDANGNMIRPEKENQKTGQKQKKSK